MDSASDGIRRIIVISRLDPIKRVDLLLDALDRCPELSSLPVRVFGTGAGTRTNCASAPVLHNPNVRFEGFQPSLTAELADSDLLVHLCPAEPFGLAILEAMAAGFPYWCLPLAARLSLVAEGESGFHFQADDAFSLASRLHELKRTPARILNQVVAGGDQALATRFSPRERVADYRRLIQEELA